MFKNLHLFKKPFFNIYTYLQILASAQFNEVRYKSKLYCHEILRLIKKQVVSYNKDIRSIAPWTAR